MLHWFVIAKCIISSFSIKHTILPETSMTVNHNASCKKKKKQQGAEGRLEDVGIKTIRGFNIQLPRDYYVHTRRPKEISLPPLQEQ